MNDYILDKYQLIYVLSYMIGTYVIFRYFSLFYNLRNNIRKTFIIAISYYFLIISLYFIVENPYVMLITNIIVFALIGYYFDRDFKKCILSSLFIYIVLMMVEIIVVFASDLIIQYMDDGVIVYNMELYQYVCTLFFVHLISYTFYFLIKNYQLLKSFQNVPILYWISVMIMPCATIYLVALLIVYTNVNNSFILMGFVLLFVVNFASFYLFENLLIMYHEKIQKIVIEQQNMYYDNQLELFQTSLRSMKSFRHDLVNHLSTLKILLHKDQVEHAFTHIEQMVNSSYMTKEYARSGNIVIDSIINFKLQEAEEYKIEVNILLKIPSEISVRSFDMVIILSNLLDNAMDATKEYEGERKLDIRMSFIKGRLIIKVENSFDGLIYVDDHGIRSKKTDEENHGLGINNVRKSIQNYNGTMDIEVTEETYSTTILLFITNVS